jgi:hypothetical protein
MTFKKDFGITELKEYVDIAKLKYIVKNWDKHKHEFPINNENDFEYNPKKLCEKYITNYTKVISIKYQKSRKYPSKMGRWFCAKGIGIQSLPRKIRHTICNGLYIDLDFKNCHPVILKTLCNKNNIECPYLINYIENRDELLDKWSKDLDISKDETKQNFLAMLNGNKTIYDTDNWVDMMTEFENIHKSISSLHEYREIYDEVSKYNFDNIFAKTTNRILCEIENKCLVQLYTILKDKKMLYVEIDGEVHIICSLIFDGLQIPDNEINRSRTTPEFLAKYSTIIEDKTGFYLDITTKPFNDILTIPENYEDDLIDDEDIIIHNDGDACEAILSKYGNMMLKCNNIKYIKSGNIWTDNSSIIKSTIYYWIYNMPMKRECGDKYTYYNRDKACINKCIDMVENMGFKTVDDFISKNQLASKKYLPFKNGVYSFVDKKLFKYDEVSVQFTEFINRDFPIYNQDSHDKLMDIIINLIYPDEEERKYFMYSLARILAGHFEDKKWFINKGSRNSGKGVITSLLQSAFDIFVGTFNANTFVSKKVETSDEDRNLMWAVCLRDKRLIISNEVDEKATLNGALIKKFSSGGDKIKGRINHGLPFEFVPQFCMMFMCNDFKDPDPIDALENCIQFYCKSKFVNKEELIEGQPFLKLKNDNVKSMIQENSIIDAFTLYVLEHYTDYMEMPESVKMSCNVLNEDRPLTLEQTILKYFRYSANVKDKLYTNDIIQKIAVCGYDTQFHARDVASILLKCGIGTQSKNGNIRIDGIEKKGYSNIIYIEKVNDNENEED